MTKCDVKSFFVTRSCLFLLSALATTIPVLGTYGLLCWIPCNQTNKQASNWMVWARFQSSRKDAAIKHLIVQERIFILLRLKHKTVLTLHVVVGSSIWCDFFRLINYYVNMSNVYKLHLYQRQVVLDLLTYLLTYLLIAQIDVLFKWFTLLLIIKVMCWIKDNRFCKNCCLINMFHESFVRVIISGCWCNSRYWDVHTLWLTSHYLTLHGSAGNPTHTMTCVYLTLHGSAGLLQRICDALPFW